MAVISAKAVLTAEDKTGAVFDAVAKKFDKLAKSTKSAENVQRLTASLKGAQEQLKAIDKFDLARGRFAAARAQFRETQVGVEKAAKAMAAAEKPTRQMEAAYKRAQVAVSAASRAFEEQKAAVIGASRALHVSGVPMNRIVNEQARLRTHVERTTRALHQQNQIVERLPANTVARRTARASEGGGTLDGLPGLVPAGRLAKDAIKQGSDMQHERVRMQAAGMSPGEIAAAESEASRLSQKYLPVSQTQIMHLLRNTRSIVGNYHEAAEIADPLLSLRVIAQGAHPDKADELGEDFDKLVKGMEIKGVTQNKPAFQHYIEGMSKAINVFGDTLRPTDYYEMFKYGRQATTALSDQFMLETSPTFAQELGGKSTGDAMAGLHEQFVGQHMSNQAAEMLLKYGLIDPKKVVRKSSGDIKKLLPGAFIGQDKYMPGGKFDPYALTNDWLLPALVKQGITDPEKQQEAIAQIGSRRSVRQALGIMSTQQARIQKDWTLSRGAKGTEAAQDFMRNDPKIGTQSIITQGNNLLANSTAPAMQEIAPVMYSAASSLARIAGLAKDHPAISTAAAGGIFSGIAAGGAKGASMLLPWIFGNAPEGGMARALTSTVGTAAKWGARGSGWTTAAMIAWDAYQNRDELGRDIVGRGDHAETGDPWRAGYDRDHPTDTLDRLRRERDARNASRGLGGSPELTPTMTYGTSVSGDRSISVSGSVTGEVTQTLKIEPSPLFSAMFSKLETVIKLVGSLAPNGPGSTGQTSPDGSAPVRPPIGGGFPGY